MVRPISAKKLPYTYIGHDNLSVKLSCILHFHICHDSQLGTVGDQLRFLPLP
jgi:hypothetical protein